jgi:putative ABC transport system ATP-binding protein
MSANPIIELKEVKKSYSIGEDVQVEALKKINLVISKGEYVSIIGPSGSGKSTLMHIIGLLDRPTSGSVFLENHEIEKTSQEELARLRNTHIGFVFQSFNLLARTTSIDNVSLPLLYAGIPHKERVERSILALTMVGLGDRLNHFPSQLSGGQQQRVAIARALVNNPSLILADEPTGNLDSKSGDEIISFLEDLNKKGNTIILVTHEMDIAKKAKRTVIIKDGLIVGDRKN